MNDLQALVPANILVSFPTATDGVPRLTPHAEVTTLTSLGLAEFQGVNGHPGTRWFHDCCVYDTAGSNAGEITALARQIATDAYLFSLGRQDTKFASIVPYIPEGMNDFVEWTHHPGEVSTRVQRGNWQEGIEELLHYSPTQGSMVKVLPGLLSSTTPNDPVPKLTATVPVIVQGGVDAQGGLLATPLKKPDAPTVTQMGTTGATTYTYGFVGNTATGTQTALSQTTTITNGNATLSSGNPASITIPEPIPTGIVSVSIVRTEGGTTQGIIGTVTATQNALGAGGADPEPIVFLDTGLDASGAIPKKDTSAQSTIPDLITTTAVVQSIPPPGKPAVTQPEGGGTKTVTYVITAVVGGQETTAGVSTVTTTANDTLDVTKPNFLTWEPPPNLPEPLLSTITYNVIRVATTDSPWTTGTIATGIGPFPFGTTPNFLDGGLPVIPGGSGGAPAVNTTGTFVASQQGGANIVSLPTPAAPTVTPLTTGASSFTYAIVARDGTGTTPASTGTTITTGAATPDNAIEWEPIEGVPLEWDVYRTAGGSTQGLIGSIFAGEPLYLLDDNLIADGSTAPVVDTTGRVLVNGTPITPGGGGTTGTNGQVLVTTPYNLTNAYAQVTGANFAAPSTGTYLIVAQVIVDNTGGFPTVDANFKIRNTTATADIGTPGHVYDSAPMQQSTITSPLVGIASLTSGDNVEVQATSVTGTGTIDSVALTYVKLA